MKSNKELKQDYKNHTFKMGVYRIINKLSGKCLVGCCTDLDTRWNSQKLQLETGTHPNAELQHDWQTLGEQNFEYEVVEEVSAKSDNPDELKKEVKALEELWLDEYLPMGTALYNKKR